MVVNSLRRAIAVVALCCGISALGAGTALAANTECDRGSENNVSKCTFTPPFLAP